MLKVSACVIVKNEAKNIRRWLACMQQLADECIVVDTGSEDETVELATQGGARVLHFDWCNDFAVAKNFALDQAHGEWILFPDADEYFPEESIPVVRDYIQKYRMDYKTVGFYCRRIELDENRPGEIFGECGQIRVFRNLRAMRYIGRVHEALHVPSGKRMQYAPDMELYHTGYTATIMKDKILRDLHILQEEARFLGEERPERFIYFMDCYYGLKEYDKGIEYAKKAIASHVRYTGMEGHEHTMLATMLIQTGRPQAEIEAVLEQGMQEYPDLPGLPMMKGLVRWDCKDYTGAEEWLEKGIQLWENPKEKVRIYTDNTHTVLPYAYEYLGRIAELRLHPDQAMDYYIRGLRKYPQLPELFQGLYRCIRALEPADQIQLLNKLYDPKKDAAFLAGMLRTHRIGQVYLYYARLAGEDLETSITGYMAAGRFDAAAVQLPNTIDGLYRLGICGVLEGRQDGAVLRTVLPEKYLAAWEHPEEQENGIACAVQRMRKVFRSDSL